ncbi:MAG TPA: peptidoglycan DD-metalloendopeptidase family protein, partial [Stellaceae bacterium]|nr:peptidoglycan DD-metalloendopeptidase family protein [Stellaceae bacterium]
DALQLRLAAFDAERTNATATRDAGAETLANRAAELKELAKSLEANRAELKQADAQRAEMKQRLQHLESALDTATAETARLRLNLAAKETELKKLAERKPVAASSPSPSSSPPPPAADTAAPASESEDEDQNNEPKPKQSGELERKLAEAGTSLEALLDGMRPVPGEGGPFYALDDGAPDPALLKNVALTRIVRQLPLGAPLASYQLRSPFGPRRDPFNRRKSFHRGMDLVAPFRSPVHTTGPGVVVFAGRHGKYGKLIEIDHGNGIHTRYAHLHAILVKRHQKVTKHQQIGELGSTGRSTGPHVHYEVIIDGVPRDPAKFIEAGNYVVKTSGQ